MSGSAVASKPDEISVHQTCKILGVTTSTVHRYIEAGEIDAYQIRPRSPYRISRASVEALLKRARSRHEDN